MNGKATHAQSLTGKISPVTQNLTGKFAPSTQDLAGRLTSAYSTNGQVYDGDYVVTPKVVEQTLHTKHRLLTDDVEVKAIPYYETSNASGGNTLYIASEVE